VPHGAIKGQSKSIAIIIPKKSPCKTIRGIFFNFRAAVFTIPDIITAEIIKPAWIITSRKTKLIFLYSVLVSEYRLSTGLSTAKIFIFTHKIYGFTL